MVFPWTGGSISGDRLPSYHQDGRPIAQHVDLSECQRQQMVAFHVSFADLVLEISATFVEQNCFSKAYFGPCVVVLLEET